MASFIVGVHVLLVALRVHWFPQSPLYTLPRLFALGSEGNLPTFFSALCLLSAGLLLAVITVAEVKRDRLYWGGLALGFIAMSVDEAAQIHDAIINPSMKSAFGVFDSQYLSYGWVVPALVLVGCMAVGYSNFLWRLPRRFAGLFVLAGLIYVGAAVGMEMVESKMRLVSSPSFTWFPWREVCEEGGEMLGVILFIYTLLKYMAFRGIRLAFTPVHRSP